AKIGHRSLMRYYKQRFGAQRAVVLTHNKNAVGRVLRQYKSLGWGGDTGNSALNQKQKDMQYVQMMKSKWMLKMGISHNTIKQKHFRAQVMF
ncbi:zinc finger protein 622-like, partial [Neolamprologus brichardi]